MKISFNKENIVKLFNMKNRLLSIITLVSLTSGMAILGGCTQEEIDAAIAAANNIANEQNQNPGQDVQQPEIVIEPEDKPAVEPEIEPEVDPVEEVNPRDYKAVYGLDFDVPIYTDEEVEQARINLDTKYENPILFKDREGTISFADNPGYAQDYYIANQNLFYAFYNAAKDMDFTKINNGIYYDEENGVVYTISKSTEKKGSIYVLFKDTDYSQFYMPSQFEEDGNSEYEIADYKPEKNIMRVGPGSWVVKDGLNDEEWIKTLFNKYSEINTEDLKNAGFKYEEYSDYLKLQRDDIQKLQYK